MFNNDEKKSVIEVPLPQFPLSNEVETVSLVLDEPTGETPAELGNMRSALLHVKHDKGFLLVLQYFVFARFKNIKFRFLH